MSVNHYEKLNESIENLNRQANQLTSLTEIYRKTDEINENFAQNLAEFRFLNEKWTNFFENQTAWQSDLTAENQNYFRAFEQLRNETKTLADKMSDILAHFEIYQKTIDVSLTALQVEVKEFRQVANLKIDAHTENIRQILADFGAGLQKLTDLEQNINQSHLQNGQTLSALEKNITAIRTQIADYLQNATGQILETLEQINIRNKDLTLKFEQMMLRQEANITQTMLAFAQKTEQQMTQHDLQLSQNLAAISRKLDQSTQFSQNQMQRSEELFRDMQMRAEDKNTFFAKQISDYQALSSRFASETDEKIDRMSKENRKFYGDLEDGLRVRIEQLKAEFQLKVREELETHISRSDQMIRTQLGEFQNRNEEKSEMRFRTAESKFLIILFATALNFMALLYLILTK